MVDMALCKELSVAVGAGESPLVPRIFEALVNDDEARVMLLASPPATVEDLAQRSGLSRDAIAGMMDSLFHRGLIFKATKGGEKKFYRVKTIPQMHDSTSLTPGNIQECAGPLERVHGKGMAELRPGHHGFPARFHYAGCSCQ